MQIHRDTEMRLLLAIALMSAAMAPVASGAADPKCAVMVRDIQDTEARLAAARERRAKGIFLGMAGSVIAATPYMTVSDNAVVQSTANRALDRTQAAAYSALDAAQPPAADAGADRKRLKELRSQAKAKGCAA